LHWKIFLSGLFLICLGILSLFRYILPLFLPIMPIRIGSGWIVFLLPIGIVFFISGSLWLIHELIRKYTSEFAVTNKRVLIKVGLIRRTTLEMNVAKIENIGVSQGILDRILNCGTISIIGSGGTKESFRGLRNPLDFRKKVQEMSR